MKAKIVGVKKAKNKNGKDCFTYTFTNPFSSYDEENAECEGLNVGSEFSYKDFWVHVGDIVDLQYERGFQDKATLSDMVVVTPAEKKVDKPSK